MANKTIYVAKGREEMWQRAVEVAAQRGISLSELISEALRRHVARVEQAKEGR